MPQLNQTIIFPQIFWLVLIFCFLYGFFLHFVLPIIASTLKIRNVLLISQLKNQNSLENKWNEYYDKYLKNLSACVDASETWYVGKVKLITLNNAKRKDFLASIQNLVVYNFCNSVFNGKRL
uniref:ATP synthase F0 subunit 8 n=1 Tax=Compsopogon caeruleus TaxID=31354 RepID=A0A1Z1XBG5_9RHOD|nr:ATP synthase F0 subunit 8 [Compsopogon caeruleus]ARX96178.1 ATP synthase F0 subunit 8 [Compsopogon caeruleus]